MSDIERLHLLLIHGMGQQIRDALDGQVFFVLFYFIYPIKNTFRSVFAVL